MPRAGLIDTGAILALLENDDKWHHACLEALGSMQLPLFTTEAVLTETFHLQSRNRRSLEQAWRFVRSGALTVRPCADADLPALHSLMSQYQDRPMDFADATLVHLASRESLNLILTIDRNDFETYRIDGRKRFVVIPSRTGE